ncbi:MAG: hypothetical protein GY910_10485 [bacterium]|nr:hypothetical protein [Deltaproteobacteria bacterium]MCP4905395.1 hypothetical protein [bacterium]
MDAWVTPTIVALWTLFLATHTGFSSQRLRPKLVARLGAQGFLGVYSAIALAIFIPLVWIYSTHKHAGAELWYGGAFAWIHPPVYLVMALAFTLLIGSFSNASPASLAPGTGEVRGVLRITRHPLFMGIAFFGLLHLFVARIHGADLAFFGGMPIVALIGCWHQDQRHLAGGQEAFRSFYEETSLLPFARGGWRAFIEAPLALAAGGIAVLLIRIFHPALFGGA